MRSVRRWAGLWCVWLAVTWTNSSAALAQAPAADPSMATPSAATLESPRATMFEFLEAIHAVRGGDGASWTRVLACFDFAGAGVDVRSDDARETAHDLWSALNHIRLVQRADLPDAEASAAFDSFRYFPRLFNEEDETLRSEAKLDDEEIELARSADGLWRFSADTVR